jgi:hypothetical protein
MLDISLGEGNSTDKIDPHEDRKENIDGKNQETGCFNAGDLHTDMSMCGVHWFFFYATVNPNLVCDT